jgi:hypothetical protein
MDHPSCPVVGRRPGGIVGDRRPVIVVVARVEMPLEMPLESKYLEGKITSRPRVVNGNRLVAGMFASEADRALGDRLDRIHEAAGDDQLQGR